MLADEGGGFGGAGLGFAVGLISAEGTPTSAVSLLAGNSSQGGKTISGADGSGLGGGQASPCPAFELRSAVLAGPGGWGAATMPADDGSDFGGRLESGTGDRAFAVGLIS